MKQFLVKGRDQEIWRQESGVWISMWKHTMRTEYVLEERRVRVKREVKSACGDAEASRDAEVDNW